MTSTPIESAGLPALNALLLIERRFFERALLVALIEARALSKRQAFAFCQAMIDDLRSVPATNAAAPTVVPLLLRKWEEIRDSLPRGVWTWRRGK